MKKSIFSIFIHDTIGFLDQTHCVAKQGKLRIQIIFCVFIFMTKNIFDLNRVQTLGQKRLKWPFSGCSFILPMNLFSSKQRHNNLIVIITQISNLSKYTNKVKSLLKPRFPPRSQKHRNMIQNKVNLFSPCFFVFFRRIPSQDGNNSTVFIIDSEFYLGETMSSIC